MSVIKADRDEGTMHVVPQLWAWRQINEDLGHIQSVIKQEFDIIFADIVLS